MPRKHTHPSKNLVKLQFIPKNPYARSALNFTSCLQVQQKYNKDNYVLHILMTITVLRCLKVTSTTKR